MKALLLLLLPLLLLGACSTPSASYAAKHPELTPAQREMMNLGRIQNGDAVAGLTKDEVVLVIGRPPDQFTTFNGQEAWVWKKRKVHSLNSAASVPMASMTGDRERASSSEQNPMLAVQEEITVYFLSGRATRATVRESALY